MSQTLHQPGGRTSLYEEITDKIVRQIEAGTLPWVQPWAGGPALSLPVNVRTDRTYSGINILLLWDALFAQGYAANRWLTFKQARELGGIVRKGEHGTTIVFADRFTPKADDDTSADDPPRAIPFLRRYTVFNIAQCDGLPGELTLSIPPISHREPVASAEALIAASGASVRRGGAHAFYHARDDYIAVPEQDQFFEPINFYRTVLHEMTHWSGAAHRLNRDFSGRFGSQSYAFEELVAEIGSAFLCAALGIVPTVRHADYIANWLAILKNDSRAVVSAASHASKAADFILALQTRQSEREAEA
ncbi:MAG: DUF1738 domain-containing protein [Alphaproteobacteria bacterium]|nr:DUF1738 domain-containing protein [Alphaproteobacteria bacterium]MDE2494697.1 DUF1738 domain-containing protein [Alphaproteobacteria bacterium]